MKIWWVNHYAIPPSEPGGTRHYSLARKLKRHGIDVFLVASSFNYVQRQERLSSSESFRAEEIDGVKFAWIRTVPYRGNSISKLRNMLSFARRFRKRASELPGGRPDLIIGSSPHPFAADEARKLAKSLGVPFIVEIRDLWPRTLVDVGGISPWHPLVLWMRRIERRLYRDAARILTLLPSSAPYFEAHGVEPGSIEWVPNGIDLDMLPPAKAPPEDGLFRVMYVGIHGLVYGLPTILDAAAILDADPASSHIRFVLVGDGPEKQALVDRAKREGLKNIEFKDSVPKEQVYDIMQEADAFLMPLKRSPVHAFGISPNKIQDYMSAARPIIFSADTSVNVVEKAGAGVTIPPEDPASLAAAAKDLSLRSPSQLQQMGDDGRSWLEANFDLDTLAKALADTLKQAIAD